MFRRRPPDSVLRQLETLSAKMDKLMLDFTALDADIASLTQEVSQAVALIQANASASSDAAANEAALATRDAQIKSLRDQLAAALAPVTSAS